MTDRNDRVEPPRKSWEPPPRRPSYDRIAENIEKWVNSSGLQKPT
ncbi:hypothetical protein [Bradyrhizobium sp.]